MSEDMEAQVRELMSFFDYAHLPARLQVISQPFGELATDMHYALDTSHSKVMCLTHLLIAKDAAVRAALTKG